MTERTTPITVHLTPEQMDNHLDGSSVQASYLLSDAIKAQRPRPIAVGDRAQYAKGNGTTYTVEAIKDGKAWIWQNGSPITAFVEDLTRVDDEATS